MTVATHRPATNMILSLNAAIALEVVAAHGQHADPTALLDLAVAIRRAWRQDVDAESRLDFWATKPTNDRCLKCGRNAYYGTCHGCTGHPPIEAARRILQDLEPPAPSPTPQSGERLLRRTRGVTGQDPLFPDPTTCADPGKDGA